MIDHVSIGVKDLERSTRLYDAMLSELGYVRMMTREHTVGYGKRYPDLWLNARPELVPDGRSGWHVCLRARTPQAIDAFYARALAEGATSDGKPGLRPEYHETYYAAFVRDFDQNLVEVVTFLGAERGD
ncbi:MAG: VOC family protein [Myxococcales bacterium]